jgi:hypothetical protein
MEGQSVDSEGVISQRTRSKNQQVTIMIAFIDLCLVPYIPRSNLLSNCSIFIEFHFQGPIPSSDDTEMHLTGAELMEFLRTGDLSQILTDSQTEGTVQESQMSCTTGECQFRKVLYIIEMKLIYP